MALALSAALLGTCGTVAWLALRPDPSVPAGPVPLGAPLDPPQPAQALVFVSGAVEQPGLYRLSVDARVTDAIAAAGGITADADPGRLPNLAAPIHDGRQVNVPFRRSGGSSSLTERVDVNTASVDELRAVAGMPLGLPEAIVEARQLWGGFATLSDLRALLALDAGTMAALRPLLRAGTSTR